MKIKSLSIIVFLLMLAATAQAQEVSYLGSDGSSLSQSSYTTVSSSTTTWNTGWYVIKENQTFTDCITVSGTVNLILCNNITLNAQKGITVGSDASFNIYAQSIDEATMGALTATAEVNSRTAAIGGGDIYTNFGSITINGGKITATTNINCGAPIGGTHGSNSGSITINGGIVSATADPYGNCAGIGGGNNGYVSSITLNGGIITATGATGYGGAGIGTGSYAGSGTMTITIGSGVKKLVAVKGWESDCIGKEPHATTTVNIVFKNGNSIVTGDDKDAVFYDSGEGEDAERQVRTRALNRSITIADNLKNSVAATECALVGETVTLTLGTGVDASSLHIKLNNETTVAHTIDGNKCTFTMPNGDVTVTGNAAATYSITLPEHIDFVSATTQADAAGKYISGTEITFKVDFPFVAQNVTDGTNTLSATNGIYTVTIGNADITIEATLQRNHNINLSDAPDDFTAIDGDVLTGSTSHTVTIAQNAKITLSNATINGGILCEGSADITLVGTNSVIGAQYKAGIQVGGSGTTLTIKGDGSLTATGGRGGAGIGTGVVFYNESNASGNITIQGGTITANGTEFDPNTHEGGSGIGKGYTYATAQSNTIGTITIYDGINMVDASSISETVVYKHGESEVTANKTDYFAVSEDGNRRLIVQKPVIADIDDQTYTGSEIKPEPQVTIGSLSLTKGSDYVYSYTNNTNAGTATVRATFKGTYESLGYVEKEFNIVNLTSENVSAIPDQTFTGSAIEPEITVTDGEKTLTLDTDYEVSYSDNTNVGTAKATITGKGNYSGTVKKTFTITPKVTILGALTLTEDENGITATLDGAYTGADAFAIGDDIEVASVTFNRTFTTSATSTIILPFYIAEGKYSGGNFYTLKSVENNIADMEKVTSVTAHTPYLFVPDGETFSITGNVTIKATTATEYATESDDGKWEFKGIYQRKRWGADDGDNKDYCFAANATGDISVGEFVKIGTFVQVKPFRCYLTRKNDISKSAEQLPETIKIRLIDETASVITPDDPQDNTGDITTPVSEIANNNGVKVWSYDGVIYIESAPATAYTIVDMTGRTLKNGVTNSTRETVTLSCTAGIVIVIINGKTFKVNY